MQPTTGYTWKVRIFVVDAKDSCISLCWVCLCATVRIRETYSGSAFLLCCGIFCLSRTAHSIREFRIYTLSTERDKNHSMFILSNLTTECKFQHDFGPLISPRLDVCWPLLTRFSRLSVRNPTGPEAINSSARIESQQIDCVAMAIAESTLTTIACAPMLPNVCLLTCSVGRISFHAVAKISNYPELVKLPSDEHNYRRH